MRFILTTIFCFSFINMKAQDLNTHKWKNRVLLIISEKVNSESYKKQINILKNNNEALLERKLVIYHILPKKYKLNNENWVASSNLFKRYNSKDETFKIVLIGLDGSVKLEENNVISAEKLFSIIDAMPMRKSEIRRD